MSWNFSVVWSIVSGVVASQVAGSSVVAALERGFIHNVDESIGTEQKPIWAPSSFYGQYSSDTTPVEILAYDVEYRIPRNYLESILTSVHDMSTGFSAVARLPKLIGVTSDPENKDGIFVGQKLMAPSKDPGIVRMISSDMPYAAQHDPNTIVFEAESGTPDALWQFGLLRSNSRSSVQDDVYFRRPSQEFAGFVANCNKYNNLCTSFLRISNQSVIIIEYNPSQLMNWRYIHEDVSNLIGKWIIKKGG